MMLRFRPMVLAAALMSIGYSSETPHGALAAADSTQTPRAASRTLQAGLEAARDSIERSLARSPHSIHPSDLGRLRELGLEDPIQDLVNNLRVHPEILPFQSAPGMSQFGFYDSTRIRILSDRWVYAYTEDGHVSRDVLLKYRVFNGGRIEWKVVAWEDGEGE